MDCIIEQSFAEVDVDLAGVSQRGVLPSIYPHSLLKGLACRQAAYSKLVLTIRGLSREEMGLGWEVGRAVVLESVTVPLKHGPLFGNDSRHGLEN